MRDKIYPHSSSSSTQGTVFAHRCFNDLVNLGLGSMINTGRNKVFLHNDGDNWCRCNAEMELDWYGIHHGMVSGRTCL